VSDIQSPKERRVGAVAVPDEILAELTEMQHQTLARLEGFGWAVGFVRRPLFQERVVMLFDPSGREHAVLNEDGTIDKTSDIPVR
jgi:cell division inhibitor SulA